MATKTSSKTETRKPAARKTTAAQEPVAEAKPKASTKKLRTDADSAHAEAAPSARLLTQERPTPKVTPSTASAPRHEVERVSLIDKKKPSKKTEEGEVRTKRDLLPPISRIRASLDRTITPPRPPTPAKTEPAPPSSAEAP